MSGVKLPKVKLPKIKLDLAYSSREPIPAGVKRKVRERAGSKCEVCHKKSYGVTLEFHHKNMKNNDNKISNIQLLCPNHHRQKHARARRKVYKDELGRPYYSRLVKKTEKGKGKKTTKKKQSRRRRPRTPLERLAKKVEKII